MGTRVPVQHFGMRSANSYIAASPLHDLNTVDSRPADMESISDVDREAVTEDSLEHNDDSNAVVSVFSLLSLISLFFFFFFFGFGFPTSFQEKGEKKKLVNSFLLGFFV